MRRSLLCFVGSLILYWIRVLWCLSVLKVCGSVVWGLIFFFLVYVFVVWRLILNVGVVGVVGGSLLGIGV